MDITIEIDKSDYTASQIEALVRTVLTQHTDLIVSSVFSNGICRGDEEDEE